MERPEGVPCACQRVLGACGANRPDSAFLARAKTRRGACNWRSGRSAFRFLRARSRPYRLPSLSSSLQPPKVAGSNPNRTERVHGRSCSCIQCLSISLTVRQKPTLLTPDAAAILSNQTDNKNNKSSTAADEGKKIKDTASQILRVRRWRLYEFGRRKGNIYVRFLHCCNGEVDGDSGCNAKRQQAPPQLRVGDAGGASNRKAEKKSARFSLAETSLADYGRDDYVEITLEVREDSVTVHPVKAAGEAEGEDPELALLARAMDKRSSLGSALIRNASSRIRQVSEELRRLASVRRRPPPFGRFDRSKSAAVQALVRLRFISKTDGGGALAGACCSDLALQS